MSQILKYTMQPNFTTLWFPESSVPLAIGWQGDELQMWVQHTLGDGPAKSRHFLAVTTGETFPEDPRRVFIGTAISDDVVVHVFEVAQ